MIHRTRRLFALVKISNRDALNKALDFQLAHDPSVFIIGEQVAQYNGAYKVTKGLFQKYGTKRLVDTPITQAGFTGLAVGASLMGLRPVCQFMTMNFSLQAIDHIINSCAKVNHMSNGIIGGSIVFRGLNGPAASVAAQHSQCFASLYSNQPGLVTVCPYDAEDNFGLLRAAIRDPNPVMFLQNEILYSQLFQTPEQCFTENYILPIGKAKVMRSGTHCTLVAYSRMVKVCLQAAKALEEKGISCQVINLRTIKPLDRTTIIQSVKKTNHIVSVEDGFPQHGVGAEIAALMFQTEAFDYLDAPLIRLTGMDVPMPYAQTLQAECTPRKQEVMKAVERLLKK